MLELIEEHRDSLPPLPPFTPERPFNSPLPQSDTGSTGPAPKRDARGLSDKSRDGKQSQHPTHPKCTLPIHSILTPLVTQPRSPSPPALIQHPTTPTSYSIFSRYLLLHALLINLFPTLSATMGYNATWEALALRPIGHTERFGSFNNLVCSKHGPNRGGQQCTRVEYRTSTSASFRKQGDGSDGTAADD